MTLLVLHLPLLLIMIFLQLEKSISRGKEPNPATEQKDAVWPKNLKWWTLFHSKSKSKLQFLQPKVHKGKKSIFTPKSIHDPGLLAWSDGLTAQFYRSTPSISQIQATMFFLWGRRDDVVFLAWVVGFLFLYLNLLKLRNECLMEVLGSLLKGLSC